MTPKQALTEAQRLIHANDIDRFHMPAAGPGRVVDVGYVIARQLLREAAK